MAPKGYSSRSRVFAELGIAVYDAVQEAVVDELLEEAEAAIDRLAADAWLVTSPVTSEPYYPTGDVFDLLNAPVSAISSVTARSFAPGDTAQALVAGSDYELIDAARGTLSIPGRIGQIVYVSYTFTTPVPTDIRRATTLLAASWYAPRLTGTSTGNVTKSITVGDVVVEYAVPTTGGADTTPAISQKVRDLVAQARRPIFV